MSRSLMDVNWVLKYCFVAEKMKNGFSDARNNTRIL